MTRTACSILILMALGCASPSESAKEPSPEVVRKAPEPSEARPMDPPELETKVYLLEPPIFSYLLKGRFWTELSPEGEIDWDTETRALIVTDRVEVQRKIADRIATEEAMYPWRIRFTAR